MDYKGLLTVEFSEPVSPRPDFSATKQRDFQSVYKSEQESPTGVDYEVIEFTETQLLVQYSF